MMSVGFVRQSDLYTHAKTKCFVEFPRGPLAIGDDTAMRPVSLAVSAGRTLALSATDSCRDRLAAFYHWPDRQSLDPAVAIAGRHRVNMKAIRAWSARKGAQDLLEEFRRAVRARR